MESVHSIAQVALGSVLCTLGLVSVTFVVIMRNKSIVRRK